MVYHQHVHWHKCVNLHAMYMAFTFACHITCYKQFKTNTKFTNIKWKMHKIYDQYGSQTCLFLNKSVWGLNYPPRPCTIPFYMMSRWVIT